MKTNFETHIEIINTNSEQLQRSSLTPTHQDFSQHGFNISETSIAQVYRLFFSDKYGNYCTLCGKQLLSAIQLKFHVVIYHNDKKINFEECFVCQKEFLFKSQLKNHVSIEHDIKNIDFVCKVCYTEFNSISDVQTHEVSHGINHYCPLCPSAFRSQHYLLKHFDHHMQLLKPYLCRICGKRFLNEVSLNIHCQRHTNLKCSVCSNIFIDDIDLLKHLRQHTKKQRVMFIDLIEQMDVDEKYLEEQLNAYFKLKTDDVEGCIEGMISSVCAENFKFECKVCNKKLSTNEDLVLHYVNHHTLSCTCTFCGEINVSYRNSWNHILKHLSNNKENITGDTQKEISSSGRFICCVCRKHFNSSALRMTHMLQHLDNTSKHHKCLICNCMVEGNENLLHHTTQHDKLENIWRESNSTSKNDNQCKSYMQNTSKRYKCDLCSVQCRTPSSLRAHNRIHTNERPFVCEDCNKSFKRFQALKLHIKVVHSEECQSLGCPLCSMKFRVWSCLLRHFLRTHKQFRRYICGLCGNRYSQNQDLKGHFKSHHNLVLPNIKSTEKKAVNEVYVIPALNENLDENDPLAIKISKIVAEEKQKFNGVVEFLKDNQRVEKNKTKNNADVSQHIQTYLYDAPEAEVAVNEVQSKELSSSVVVQATETIQNKIFQCFFCHQTFFELSDCQNHLQRRSLYFCNECNINFCDEQSNYLHNLLKHNIIMNKCDICKQSFVTKELLSQHLSFCKNSIICSNVDYTLVVSPTILKTFHDNPNCTLKIDENSCSTINKTVSNSDTSNVCKTGENEFQKYFENTQALNFVKQNNCYEENQQTLQLPVQKLLDTCFYSSSIKASVSGDSNITESCINIEVLADSKSVCCKERTVNNLNKDSIQPKSVINPLNGSEKTLSHITINNENNTGKIMIIETIGNLNMENSPYAEKNKLENRARITNSKLLPVTCSRISETDKSLFESCRLPLPPPTISERFSKNSEEFKISVHNGNIDLDECKSEKSGDLYCAKCYISFTDSDSYQQHVKRHNVVRPYNCDVCDKHFACKPYVKTHKYKHTGELPYTCGECGKGMRYPADLAEHIRKHFKLKPFECRQCGKKFIRQYDLRRHLAIHSQRKRYKCPLCEKSFHRLDTLKFSHMRIHNDKSQQPMYTCSICEKKYTSINILRRHNILHYGKTFKCQLCEKSFSHKAYLNQHVKKHANKNEYVKCTKCPRKFKSEDTLKKHYVSFHTGLAKKKQKLSISSEGTDANLCEVIDEEMMNNNQLQDLDEIPKSRRNCQPLINKISNVNDDNDNSNSNIAKETVIENLEMIDINYMNVEYIIGGDKYDVAS